MAADGSNPRAVTAEETAALSPEFLPNGRIIYSRRNKQRLDEIVSVNSDGTGAINRKRSLEEHLSRSGPWPFQRNLRSLWHGSCGAGTN